ncbi:hypothetical protein MHU86_10398 [Fragilaria crotonensis]|nr:hypothetical protein MHU86_10398 [Fragilaria crotonensis]
MNTIAPFPAPPINNDAALLAVPATTRESDLEDILVGRRSILRVTHLWSSSTLSSFDSTEGTEDEDSVSDITDFDFMNDDGATKTATTVTHFLTRDDEDRLTGTVCSMRPQPNQVCELPVSQTNVLPSKRTGTNTAPHKYQEPSSIRGFVTSGCVVPASSSHSSIDAPLMSGDALSVGIRKPRWFLRRARFQFLKFSISQRSIQPTVAWGTQEWEC